MLKYLKKWLPPTKAEKSVGDISSLPEWAQKEFAAKEERIKVLQKELRIQRNLAMKG